MRVRVVAVDVGSASTSLGQGFTSQVVGQWEQEGRNPKAPQSQCLPRSPAVPGWRSGSRLPPCCRIAPVDQLDRWKTMGHAKIG